MANTNWALWESLLSNGNEGMSERDVAISDGLNSFIQGMVNDPAYQESATVNGVETPMLVTPDSSIKCDLKAAPSTDLHIGDLVGVFGENWIVTELYVDKLGIINAVMWMCNDIIRFQNHAAPIYTKYCVVDDGSYSKIADSGIVRQMNNSYKIYLSYDDESKKLFVDKRLSLGHIYNDVGEEILEVYKIVGIDLKTKNHGAGSHLMTLTVQRDVYDKDADNFDENVCDFYEDGESRTVPTATGYCYIEGKEKIKIGTSRTFTPTFVDANSVVNADVVPVWNVTAPDGITYVAGANCKINIPLDESYIGSEISINLRDGAGVYGEYEMKVKVIAIG